MKTNRILYVTKQEWEDESGDADVQLFNSKEELENNGVLSKDIIELELIAKYAAT